MAGNAEQSALFSELKAQGRIVVRESPKFDLESYISNYEGRTRLDRLNVIAYTSAYLSADAFKAAITEAKQGKDVDYYLHLVEGFQKLAFHESLATVDQQWMDTKVKQVKAETERLEQELKAYKNNLIKESIRMGNEDLGAHYYSCGDLQNAFKAYSRMREYCTTAKHIAEMSFKLVLVSIAQRNWMTLQGHLLRIQTLSMKPEDQPKITPILNACFGLAHLGLGQYYDAANAFLWTDPSYITAEPIGGIAFQTQVLTPNDIAVYGGLCALASMDRRDLQTRVLENSNFRQFLELEPHIRRAIALFCGSKYSACLEILEACRTDYLLDLYLQPHVMELYAGVRSKSIVEFFRPFSCVTLEEMQNAFPSTARGRIEDELVDMIQRGVLDARVDLVDRLLISPQTNPRTAVHTSALTMAAEYEKTLRLRLFRLNMQNAQLEVKAPKSHNAFEAAGGMNAAFHETGGGVSDGFGGGKGKGPMSGAFGSNALGMLGGGLRSGGRSGGKGGG